MTRVVGIRQGRGGCVAGKLITGGVSLQEECGRVCQQCSHQQPPSQSSHQPSWSQTETIQVSTNHKFEMQWRRFVWLVERQFDHWWIWDWSLAMCLDQQSTINALQCPAGSCAWRRLVFSSAEQLRGLTTAAWSHDVFLFLRSSALYNISENKHQEIPRKFLLKIPWLTAVILIEECFETLRYTALLHWRLWYFIASLSKTKTCYIDVR